MKIEMSEMSGTNTERKIPDFVFVCGAVGSGNSFMFSCLTQDKNIYGIDEDGLGPTLHNLIRSESVAGKCPHSTRSFTEFMYSLRGDRQTLVLKTPSNIRYQAEILKFLPSSHFILMIREPHAAMVSGLERHKRKVEVTAQIWLSDNQLITQLTSDSMVVTFDDFVLDPVSTLSGISNRLMPLSPEVFKYADRIKRPEHADPKRWHTKVDERTRGEIEDWVDKLHLDEFYDTIRSFSKLTGQPTGEIIKNTNKPFVLNTFTLIKRLFFQIWYKLKKYIK